MDPLAKAVIDAREACSLHLERIKELEAACAAKDDAIQSLLAVCGHIDNGHCAVCHSHRTHDEHGRPQPCMNPSCQVFKAQQALNVT